MRTQLVITPPIDLNRPVVEPCLAAEVRKEIIAARVMMAVGLVMWGAAAALPASGMLQGDRFIVAAASVPLVSVHVFTWWPSLLITGLAIARLTPNLFVPMIVFPGLLVSGVMLGIMGLLFRRQMADYAELKPLYVAIKAATAQHEAAKQEWYQACNAAGIGPTLAAFGHEPNEAVRQTARAYSTTHFAMLMAKSEFDERLHLAVECHQKIHSRWVEANRPGYSQASDDISRGKFMQHLEAEEAIHRGKHVDKELLDTALLPDALNNIILSYDLPAGYDVQRVPKPSDVSPASNT